MSIDLDDRQSSEALEVHVEHPHRGEVQKQSGLDVYESEVCPEAKGDVEDTGPGSTNDHAHASTELVHDGPVEHGSQAIEQGREAKKSADLGRCPPIGIGDLLVGNAQVVAPHVQGRIGDDQDEPVGPTAQDEGMRVVRKCKAFHGRLRLCEKLIFIEMNCG